MSVDLWLRLAHVAGALVWIGGDVALALVGVRLRRTRNLARIGRLARTLSSVGVRVITRRP